MKLNGQDLTDERLSMGVRGGNCHVFRLGNWVGGAAFLDDEDEN